MPFFIIIIRIVWRYEMPGVGQFYLLFIRFLSALGRERSY